MTINPQTPWRVHVINEYRSAVYGADKQPICLTSGFPKKEYAEHRAMAIAQLPNVMAILERLADIADHGTDRDPDDWRVAVYYKTSHPKPGEPHERALTLGECRQARDVLATLKRGFPS